MVHFLPTCSDSADTWIHSMDRKPIGVHARDRFDRRHSKHSQLIHIIKKSVKSVQSVVS